MADVTTNKGAKTLTLHATTSQFVQPSPPTPHQINTVGDYIQTIPPFLQQLVPPLSELGQTLFSKAELLLHGQHISARASCSANTQKSQIHVYWSIHDGHETRLETRIQHQAIIQSHQEETRNTRGLHLGIIGIHIIITAVQKNHLSATTISLNQGAHAIYDWTRFAAPRQGFNCLAKHNTDVEKEQQHWFTTTTTPFTEPNNPNHTTEHDANSDSDDNAEMPLCNAQEA
jgi:hypothetical protein